MVTFKQTLTGNLVEAATHMSGLRRLAALRQKKNHPLPFLVATKILAFVFITLYRLLYQHTHLV